MTTLLTSRERAHLKARAHALEPIVHVGLAGVTPEIIAEVDRALAAHELIKVRIGGSDREDRVARGGEVAAATQSAVVHRVGKVLILWRPRPTDAS
jgi:RNA-binding protein